MSIFPNGLRFLSKNENFSFFSFKKQIIKKKRLVKDKKKDRSLGLKKTFNKCSKFTFFSWFLPKNTDFSILCFTAKWSTRTVC